METGRRAWKPGGPGAGREGKPGARYPSIPEVLRGFTRLGEAGRELPEYSRVFTEFHELEGAGREVPEVPEVYAVPRSYRLEPCLRDSRAMGYAL